MFIFIGNQFIISKIKSAGILIYILREHNYSMALNFKVPVVLKKEKNIFIIILWDSTSRSFSRLCSWELCNIIIKFRRSCVVLDY